MNLALKAPLLLWRTPIPAKGKGEFSRGVGAGSLPHSYDARHDTKEARLQCLAQRISPYIVETMVEIFLLDGRLTRH